ncbi:alpha/beta hydrolase [Piscinibacter sakaiensis]|uniref:alpha/beta hydrolase n=1 Tax=Piscinibacter sakaiensis TaxID=1547922 RepID=UPI003AAE2174
MKRDLLFTILVVALLYLAFCALMFLMQRSMIYYPRARAVTAAESTMKLPVDGGGEIVVTVRPHAGPKAIIYFGGNAEDVSLNLGEFSAAFPDHALFLMHYPGYGGSSGSPSEAAIHRDAAALFRVVHRQHPQVALIGRSLGSGVAARLASQAPASRLILVTPFDSLVDVAAPVYPFLPVRWLLLDRYESGQVAAGIGIPTTLIAAEHDEIIPMSSTRKLAARFGDGVASLTVIRGASHNDLDASPDYLRTMQRALAVPADG